MPLKLRRFCTSVSLVLVSTVSIAFAQAGPTSGEVMRERISKAKAYIAVRNYNAAIYELENIRRETADPAVQAVVNVLLMNSYLEQSDYKRAQELLNEFYAQQKTTRAGADANYFAVAAQVVNGARDRIERYRALGLNVTDRTLPLEATNDIEKMRETLELVVTQSKEIGKDKNKTAGAMALLEEAAVSRSMMARDDYDARRWRDEVADTREQLASSRSVVINAVNDGVADGPVTQPNASQIPSNTVASITPNSVPNVGSTAPAFQPVAANNTAARPIYTPADTPPQKPLIQSTVSAKPTTASQQPQQTSETTVQNPTPNVQRQPVQNRTEKPVEKPTDAEENLSPMNIGSSLVAYATTKASPVYPAAAKSIRQSGIVRVEVTVDESGQVAEVQNATGPAMLQSAARDAIRKWRFKPFTRDGQPVRATGFVNFNFSL
jgi:TonB family protein